jgi:hypothetical protein
MSARNCHACRFFHPQTTMTDTVYKDEHGNNFAGECRRRDPQIVASRNLIGMDYEGTRVWPIVYFTDWCGEWSTWPDNEMSDAE